MRHPALGAVEQLAVVESLHGLQQESPSCGMICGACTWLDQKGVSPSWLATGLIVGGWRGAFGTSVGSWLYRRCTSMPTDSLFGVGLAALIAYVLDRRR